MRPDKVNPKAKSQTYTPKEPLFWDKELPVYNLTDAELDEEDVFELVKCIFNDTNEANAYGKKVLKNLPDESQRIVTVDTDRLSFNELKEALRVLKPDIGMLVFKPRTEEKPQ